MSSIANSIEAIYAEMHKTAAAPEYVVTPPWDYEEYVHANPELGTLLKLAADYTRTYTSDVSIDDVLTLVYGSDRAADDILEYAVKTAAGNETAKMLFNRLRNMNKGIASKAPAPGPMPVPSVQLPPPNLPHLTSAAPATAAPAKAAPAKAAPATAAPAKAAPAKAAPAKAAPANAGPANAGPPPGVPKGAVQPPGPRVQPDPDALRAIDRAMSAPNVTAPMSAGASSVKAPSANISSRASAPPRAFTETPDEVIRRMEARLQRDMRDNKTVPDILGRQAPPSRPVVVPDDIHSSAWVPPPSPGKAPGGAAANAGPPPGGAAANAGPPPGGAAKAAPDADVDDEDIKDLTGRGWKLPLGLATAGALGTAGAYHYGKNEAAEEARRNRNLAFGAGMATGVAAPKIISRAGQAMSNFGGQGAQPGYYY